MACPVCFSAVEPSIRESMNIGILVLLGVTVGVLACFARFFLLLARRAREADQWERKMTPDPVYPEAS